MKNTLQWMDGWRGGEGEEENASPSRWHLSLLPLCVCAFTSPTIEFYTEKKKMWNSWTECEDSSFALCLILSCLSIICVCVCVCYLQGTCRYAWCHELLSCRQPWCRYTVQHKSCPPCRESESRSDPSSGRPRHCSPADEERNVFKPRQRSEYELFVQ